MGAADSSRWRVRLLEKHAGCAFDPAHAGITTLHRPLLGGKLSMNWSDLKGHVCPSPEVIFEL